MKYYLYLDEMLENLTTGVDYFSLAGFAVSKIERDILDAKFNKLKNRHNIIGSLHWTDIRRFKKIWSKKSEKEIRVFLEDFNLFLEEANIVTFASMYNVRLIQENIKSKKWHNHSHVYAMKKIFENFFIFLNKENSKFEEDIEGYVIVEASTIDEELKKLFHSIMIFGTDFISQQGLTKLIKNIEFISKSQNNNLLQIADPMPSELHRLYKKNEQFSKKLSPYKNEFQKIRKTINDKCFKGYNQRGDLFGIHILE
jgi:hypothetical protein